MLNTIQGFVSTVLPSKRKKAPNGWVSFNCPCCTDRRGRGGVLFGANGEVSYHCFNCPTKAYYKPGHNLSYSFRKLLKSLSVSDNEIRRLVLEALRIKSLVSPESVTEETKEKAVISFEKKPLPSEALPFLSVVEFYTLKDSILPKDFNDVVEYVYNRSVNLQEYEFYWSSDPKYSRKVIVPFYWNTELVGYSVRPIDDGVGPKYLNIVDTGYVFNVNKQHKDWKFVVVTEGLFDAMAIDGVAVMHNEVSEQQADIIDSLGREVIVVPDWDKPGETLINEAIKYDWNVSFPIWRDKCKDINEAVVRYGKLFVMKTILAAVETSKLKIELRKKL